MTARATVQALAVTVTGLLTVVALSRTPASGAISAGQSPKDPGCVSCHRNLNDDAVELFSRSVHARVGFACTRCHGGNGASPDKGAAHSGSFSGKLDKPYEVCGSCHTVQLAKLKASRHFTGTKSRVDCIGCHGAHSVGSPTRNFNLGYYCAGCHGLEYLPEHPTEFRKLLAIVDRQTESMNGLITAGKQPSADLLKLRRETRNLMGEAVHTTNMRGALDNAPRFLTLDENFNREMARLK